MNQKEINLQGISNNLKYIFTDRGILETAEYLTKKKTRFIDYSYENLPLAVLMMEENYKLQYGVGNISLQEYANSARRFLYTLLEIVKPEGQSTIIKEWENKFGSHLILINESTNQNEIKNKINDSWNSIRYIITESWYNPLSWDWKGGVERAAKWVGDTAKGAYDWTKDQAKQISQKGLFTWAGEKVSEVWNSVKDAVAKTWKCLSNNFFECLMEGLREASFSTLGIGAMTALTFVEPIGHISDFIVFGSLLIWDIYKALSGKYESGKYKWSFVDIIVDAVCLLLPALGGALKAGLKGVTTATELGLKAATEGGIFAKTLGLLKNGTGKIFTAIGKSSEWLGEKMGLKFLENFGSKTKSFVEKSIKTAVDVAEKNGANLEKPSFGKVLKNSVKKLSLSKPIPVVAKSVGKTILITGALCSALGLDGWSCKEKIENGEVSKEQLEKAQRSLKSEKFSGQLDQLSVADAEKIGLF
jgi:hypothetical protein